VAKAIVSPSLFAQDLYEQFGWGLFEGEDGHAYDVLQNSLLDGALLTKYKV
jgi:hypothetical protein